MVRINPLILSISLHNDTRTLQNTAEQMEREKMNDVGFHVGSQAWKSKSFCYFISLNSVLFNDS